MAIVVKWNDEEKNSIRLIYEGRWDWTEYYTAHDTSHAMIDEVEHTVDLVYDLDNTSYIPNDALGHFKRTARSAPTRQGLTILIGGNMFMWAMFNMFQKFVGDWATDYRFVTSEEEVNALLSREKV